MRERLSPNADDRPGAAVIDMLVLHYTGMPSAADALDRLCDPTAQVSAHWLVDEDGTVWRLVPEERRAWHAGASAWAGRSRLNDVSIGIELVNPGHAWGYRPFPAAQLASLVTLARGIVRRWRIPPQRVLGHADIAPARKEDPGELFDWRGLAQAGIGLWPAAHAVPVEAGEAVARALRCVGYDLDQPGVDVACATRAFQRHWRQERVDGIADRETRARLAGLLALINRRGRA